MSNLANHALVMAGGYFAIMNPIANAAIFTSLTAGMDERVARRIALRPVTYLCFRLGERVENRIGASGLRVTTQLMGLILAVIGVQMGIDGVLGAVDLYLHPAGG